MNYPMADLLGLRVHMLGVGGFVEQIEQFVENGQTAQVVTLNAEISEAASKNKSLTDIINRAQLVTPDGISIIWALKQLGYAPGERVTGIDLLYALCQAGSRHAWKVFLLGAAPGVAERAAANLLHTYPGLKIAGTHSGFFSAEEEAHLVATIAEAQPDLVFVGMGAPKQEFWLDKYLPQLPPCVGMGVGGSFDVVSGMKKRAPAWTIKLNIEWLYRLLAEPSRLKRQMVLPRFMWRIKRSARHRRRQSSGS